jgi:hypothetical protein
MIPEVDLLMLRSEKFKGKLDRWTNHFFASLCARLKRAGLKRKTGVNQKEDDNPEPVNLFARASFEELFSRQARETSTWITCSIT